MSKKQRIQGLSIVVFLFFVLPTSTVMGYSFNMHTKNDEPAGISEISTEGLNQWYMKPRNYTELVQWYLDLEQQYPNYLEVFKANTLYNTGNATGGYDLYYVRITNESLGLHKPEVLFIGGAHGDETVGTIGLYWFTNWLMRMAFTNEQCTDYSKNWLRWLIDNREIYIEVSDNPYGFDHGQRGDGNGWDLNREADMDGPGYPTGGIWGSVNGKTLRAFIDHHMIRAGCDFHGGARLLLYPWASTHQTTCGTSPISGKTYSYAPPDFFFFDVSSLRLGDYIGDYGGNLNADSVGTIPDTVGYSAQGGICPWAYGANVVRNPAEDPYVENEIWQNYPGAGILWLSPEMSYTKNPAESSFGNDTIPRYGAEVRRIILHQTDLAQPYLQWQPDSIQNNAVAFANTPINFTWQINGSLVVDHTSIQYGNNPDPIHTWTSTTTDHNEYDGDYIGGTGWDDAESGHTIGTTYREDIVITTPGEYYFVAKAQVDQQYANVLHSDIYGANPYLRLVNERTNVSYHEELQGSDGIEIINGQTWWYSSIIHVTVRDNAPEKPTTPLGKAEGKIRQTYNFSTSTTDLDTNDSLYYQWNWGDGTVSNWMGPYHSGEITNVTHSWTNKGTYSIRVKARDKALLESNWSDPLTIHLRRDIGGPTTLLQWLLQHFPNAFPLLRLLLENRQ
jgi:hypothetical protein